jgi:hypothetical protein
VLSTAPEIAALVLALVLGTAAANKLARRRRWAAVLAGYRLPKPVRPAVALAVPAAELGIAALLIGGSARAGGLLAAAMLACFSVAVLAARRRLGARIPCGCFGSARDADYRWLLARNAVLLTLSGIAASAGSAGALAGSPPVGETAAALLTAGGVALALWTARSALGALRA